jgi:hypothetical protein
MTTPVWMQELLLTNNEDFIKYVHEVLNCPYARVLPNSCVLLPTNLFVLVQRIKPDIMFCPECDDYISIVNMRTDANYKEVVDKYCIHSKAANILSTKEDRKTTELDVEKDKNFVVQQKPIQIAIVYPRNSPKGPQEKRNLPGVVVLTTRMTKRRCKTCKGREGCIHLNIFASAEAEDEAIKCMEKLTIRKNPAAGTNVKVGTDVMSDDKFDFKKKPRANLNRSI